jgi:hypothetical protein
MGELRMMSITPETPFEKFLEDVRTKLDRLGLDLKFIDSDGDAMTLRDRSDY